MGRQFYSDKYIKHKRGAEKDEDIMMQARAVSQQAESEEREAERRLRRERAGDEMPEAKHHKP